MNNIVFVISLLFLLYATPAHADKSQAREVARLNNCMPKKIEVYDKKIASNIQTIYKVGCIIPKAVGSGSKKDTALLIRCNGSLCSLMRPIEK